MLNPDQHDEKQFVGLEYSLEFNRSDLELAGCFRRLLKSRFMVRSRNEKWFQVIVDRRQELQKHFSPMGVHLETNEALGVAFLKARDERFEEALDYQLGKKRQLSPQASALLFFLRHQRLQYFLHPTADAVPLVNINEMREFLEKFNSSRMDSQFERSFRKAIADLEELQVLLETKAESGLFEITPLCEILLPLGDIQKCLEHMQAYFKHFEPAVEENSQNGSDQSSDQSSDQNNLSLRGS